MSTAAQRFIGKVEKGRIVVDDPKRWAAYLTALIGKRFELSIRPWRKGRTLRQLAYVWAGVYPYIADGSGHSDEEIHEAMKELHCPRKEVTLRGGEVVMVKSTRLLNDSEMSEYIHNVKMWGMEHGVTFPEPDQVGVL